jgi:hypothetical protein
MPRTYRELSSTVRQLHQDLVPHIADSPPLGDKQHYDSAFRNRALYYPDSGTTLLYDTFTLANAVVKNFTEAQEPPLTALGRVAIDTAKLPSRPYVIDDIGDEACFQAELRLQRSLAFDLNKLNSPNTKDPSPSEASHGASAVVFDAEGEPFAYQKASGIPSAYAWCDGVLNTESGQFFIPGSSFFGLDYDTEADDPCNNYAGAGLVSLEHAPQPNAVHFMRFATNLLPSAVARAAHRQVIEEAEIFGRPHLFKLEDNIPAADAMTPEAIRDDVYELLRRGAAKDIRSTQSG